MNINRLFILSALTLTVSACQDTTPEINILPDPNPGKEVEFGAKLDENAISRTFYDDENDLGFPILWNKGDEVFVSSPHASQGRSQAVYVVSEEESEGREYAGVLTKKGEIGVQWGSSSTGDFYSIYPAKYVSESTNTSFKVEIDNNQRNEIEILDASDVTVDGYTQKANPDMTNCFMYAKTFEAHCDKAVNLRYKPLSTAIRIILRGPSINGQIATINNVKLHAPYAIAGDFTVDLENAKPTAQLGPEESWEDVPPTGDPVITLGSNTSNEINILPFYKGAGEGYLTLASDELIELNAFIIPQANLSMNDVKGTDGWYVEITLDSGQKLKKSLTGTPAEDGTLTLTAGMIHRLPVLPKIVIDPKAWDPKNWMVNIPRNVYLSEISIPGSWNSLNEDFQNQASDWSTTLQNQYDAGCRAFHIDTRWNSDERRGTIGLYYTKPSDVEAKNELAVANGGNNLEVQNSYIGTDQNRAMWKGISFKSVLEAIVAKVQPDEYMIVICSFAQDSYTRPNKTWMDGVAEACSGNSKIILAENVTPETVVGDVLGHAIVIVNCESQITDAQGTSQLITLPSSNECLFTYMPQLRSAASYASAFSYDVDWLHYDSKARSGIIINNTLAQVTSKNSSGIPTESRGYAPTMDERKRIGKNILDASKTQYGSTTDNHDKWIYLGLGGYYITSTNAGAVARSYGSIAETLNGWIDGFVTNMKARPTGEQTTFYPVGIVMMNFIDTDKKTYKWTEWFTEHTEEYNVKGKTTANDILQLNNKFHKAYKKDWTPASVTSAAPGYSSGYKTSSKSAIGWD